MLQLPIPYPRTTTTAGDWLLGVNLTVEQSAGVDRAERDFRAAITAARTEYRAAIGRVIPEYAEETDA
jgi:hypothetical protein